MTPHTNVDTERTAIVRWMKMAREHRQAPRRGSSSAKSGPCSKSEGSRHSHDEDPFLGATLHCLWSYSGHRPDLDGCPETVLEITEPSSLAATSTHVSPI